MTDPLQITGLIHEFNAKNEQKVVVEEVEKADPSKKGKGKGKP